MADHAPEPAVTRTATEARQGTPRGWVRRVLAVSLTLALLGMVLAWLFVVWEGWRGATGNG